MTANKDLTQWIRQNLEAFNDFPKKILSIQIFELKNSLYHHYRSLLRRLPASGPCRFGLFS